MREGLDIALHDLVGRASGLPLHCLLGGRRRQIIHYIAVIDIASPEVMARRAGKWVQQGCRYLKVKFRGVLEADIEALRAVREKVGEDVGLQADANGVYSFPGRGGSLEVVILAEKIKELELNLNILEDPVEWNLEDYRFLKQKIKPIKLMVDKAAYWPNIFRVIYEKSADIINHHPNNQGGLRTALKIDAIAEANGIPTALVSSGHHGIQDAAFQHLSAVISPTRPYEDIGVTPYVTGPMKNEYERADPSIVEEPSP